MRLLADENFPRPTVEALRTQGHDVTWARTLPERVTPLVLAALASRSDWAGHFSVVSPEGIRMVRLTP